MQDKLINYKSSRGKDITTFASDAIASYKKDLTRLDAGQWVDKRGFEALKQALADNNIDINAEYTKATATPKAQAFAKRTARTYTQQVEQDGDINNLLSAYGCAVAAE